jgi:hypothetical protein
MSHGDHAAKTGWPRSIHGKQYFDRHDEEEREAPPPSRAPDAAECLVAAALGTAGATAILERLAAGAAFALVVRVPSAAWVEPVADVFETIDDRLRIYARDGSSKATHKADVGNGEVGEHLSSGRSVVGIANSIAMLPRALAAAADASIQIKLDAAVVADAVARFVGDAPAAETVEGLGSLDFHDIVSAFRAGSTAAEIYGRLRTAGARLHRRGGDRLPRLTDAVEYSEARDFGLALGRSFEDWKAGRVEWGDLSEKNCVFAGPSGLGKTYFARVLAAHLGIPLIASSISETFASSAGFLDSVIKAIRDTFARAECNSPCVLFWDELDALPMRAALTDGRSSSWWTPVVTEFLTLLDSAVASDREGVFVWAATNYAERIDPALVRPGRLDRTIHFAAPGPAGIASILRHQLGPDLAGVDLAQLGQIGIGRSPAELSAVVKQARSVARQARRALAYDDLVDALVPRTYFDPATLRRVAHHEAGHVVVALALRVDEVVAAAVGGAGDGFGRTVIRRRDGIETRATIEDRVCANLGGRAAEAVIYGGDCSANAGSDLATATEAIAGLHVSSGLAGELAYLGDEKAAATILQIDRTLRESVNADLSRLQARAIDIVRRHRDSLDAIAAALAARRHLTGDQVRAIFEAAPARDIASAAS